LPVWICFLAGCPMVGTLAGALFDVKYSAMQS
jgi:hypothetical protein